MDILKLAFLLLRKDKLCLECAKTLLIFRDRLLF